MPTVRTTNRQFQASYAVSHRRGLFKFLIPNHVGVAAFGKAVQFQPEPGGFSVAYGNVWSPRFFTYVRPKYRAPF